MFDAAALSSKLVLEKLKEPLVLDRLLLIARRRTGSNVAANDLVDKAIERVLDPQDSPWDPSRGSFFTHMTLVMRQSLDRTLRKAAAKREALQGDLYDLPEVSDPEPLADEQIDRHRTVGHWQSVLKQVLLRLGDKNQLARRVLDLAARGVEEPAEQARMLGCDVKDVYRAHETVKYHAKVALAERELSERKRMESLREKAAKEKTEAMP